MLSDKSAINNRVLTVVRPAVSRVEHVLYFRRQHSIAGRRCTGGPRAARRAACQAPPAPRPARPTLQPVAAPAQLSATTSITPPLSTCRCDMSEQQWLEASSPVQPLIDQTLDMIALYSDSWVLLTACDSIANL